MATNLWTWSGAFFGYRDGDNLWTFQGKHVGKFREDEVYDRHGNYLGEIRSASRLITDISKGSKRTSSFSPFSNRMGIVKYTDYIGNVMIVGYQDFPNPKVFD